jgi:hypothetical protein
MVRWGKGGTKPGGVNAFSVEMGMRTMNQGQDFLYIRESY